MRRQKFYVCKHCGNISVLAVNTGASLMCCGEKMAEIIPNTVDASREKHVPVVTKDAEGLTVTVGEVPHPMEEKHYIGFVFAETKNGGQRKNLRVGSEPAAKFAFTDDEPIAIYAYCNLHGLWVVDL
ncbi:MAG: desulfoferrodoxin [Chitinispirillia bacterium]|nr:desulfoferrodoxin [Chitinispirillia bacterium]